MLVSPGREQPIEERTEYGKGNDQKGDGSAAIRPAGEGPRQRDKGKCHEGVQEMQSLSRSHTAGEQDQPACGTNNEGADDGCLESLEGGSRALFREAEEDRPADAGDRERHDGVGEDAVDPVQTGGSFQADSPPWRNDPESPLQLWPIDRRVQERTIPERTTRRLALSVGRLPEDIGGLTQQIPRQASSGSKPTGANCS